MSQKLRKGMTLVEVVVGVAILSVFFLVLADVFNLYLSTSLTAQKSVKATFLAEEGIEAVKFMRKVSWDNRITTLSSNTPFYVFWHNNTWYNTTDITGTYIDGYERSLMFSDVNRDASYNIVSSGGTLDPNTRELVVTVSWKNNNATTTKTLKTYIMNLYDN